LFDQLAIAGIAEVVLLAGYRADVLRRTLGDWYDGLHLRYSVEPEPLGTAGALRWALDLFDSSGVLLLNGDSYCDVDLGHFHLFHEQQSSAVSLVLTRVNNAGRFGRIVINDNKRVTRFEEKRDGGSGWINAGVYLLERSLLGTIPLGMACSLERDFFPQWTAEGRVSGYRHVGRFIDIGTPESYAEATEFFRETPLAC